MLLWLKRSLPQNLYARGALILLVPMVTLQLVVTLSFLQRHFEDVTRQLTQGVILETNLIRDADLGLGATAQAVARRLEMDMQRPEDAFASSRWFFDVSGITVLSTFRAEMNGFVAADLTQNPRGVHLLFEGPRGLIELRFDRRRLTASNPHQLLVITIFVGALMTFVAYAFLRNQLKPIKKLSAAADAFGKGRTLPYQPSGALEVKAAGKAFLDMRARIEQQIEQRTLMLSGVSHDLRTPLTRMKLELSLLEPRMGVDALQQDLSEMEALLEAFLDFSRSGAREDMAEVQIVELVRAEAEKAERLGRDVAVFVAGDVSETVLLRPIAVQRALANLIGNALRYGTKARVALSQRASHIHILVEDDGPGIPADRREEALRPFARLDQARNQDKGSGVGLGLAIAADVARSHGGDIVLGTSFGLGGLSADISFGV